MYTHILYINNRIYILYTIYTYTIYYIYLDHPSWRSVQHKYTKWHYNFNHGDAYFVIPPFPFAGEVECYNFLLSHRIWEW